MKIIDAHTHVNFNGFDCDKLIKYLDDNEIEKCWLMSWEEKISGNWLYLPLKIEDIYHCYKKYHDRIIPMYAPDPNLNDACNKLKYWYEKGIRGCAEMKFTLNWNSSKIEKLLKTISELKIPLTFHMEENNWRFFDYNKVSLLRKLLLRLYQSEKPLGLPKLIMKKTEKYTEYFKNQVSYYFPGYMLDFISLEKRLIDFPEINFVGHGSMFWKYIDGNADNLIDEYPKSTIENSGIVVQLLKKYDNLYIDLSGSSGFNALKRDEKFIKNFLIEFSDKILFGTDNYLYNHKQKINEFDLSEKVNENIFYKNAEKLIKEN